MRVLVTGAAGYIGQALLQTLRPWLARRAAGGADAELLLSDLVAVDTAAAATPPISAAAGAEGAIRCVVGDIADPRLQAALFAAPIDLVFHLAGVVSGAAEADFARGKRVNLDATIGLLELCRAQAGANAGVARLVYASSIAVFGVPLPTRIDDRTEPAPTLSYGSHKRACELLIDDYTRRGFVDGRALRLPGVVVRPPLANGALSGFNSDLLREPLAGRSYVCPVSRQATVWLSSKRSVVANLLRLAELEPAALGARRAVTAPALAVGIDDILAALGRADPEAPGRVRFEPQPDLEPQFGRWPRDCDFERASALGLVTDASLDALLDTET